MCIRDRLERAEHSTKALFSGQVMSLSASEIYEVFQGSPSVEIPRTADEAPSVLEVLTQVGLVKSKGEGRRLIQNQGVSINERKPDHPNMNLSEFEAIEDNLFVIRKGSKSYFLVTWG